MAENTEREDLEHLVSMPGWTRFVEMVNRQWGTAGDRYKDAIINAAKGDDVNALQQLRQIIVAQREIQAVMSIPLFRINQLKQTPEKEFVMSRRGGL